MYAGDHERVAADAEQQGQVPLVPLSLLSSADLIHTSIHNCLMQRHCYAALKPESSLTHWHACLQVTASVSSVSLPMLSSKGTSLVPQLIHDYLMHHRCWQTAAILSKDLLCPQVCVCASHPITSDFNYLHANQVISNPFISIPITRNLAQDLSRSCQCDCGRAAGLDVG